MSNKVSIIRDGNEFPLTNEEIENVYRFQEKRYRLQDAETQVTDGFYHLRKEVIIQKILIGRQ